MTDDRRPQAETSPRRHEVKHARDHYRVRLPIMVVGEVLRTKPDLLRNQKARLCGVKYLLINPDARDKMVGRVIGEDSRLEKE